MEDADVERVWVAVRDAVLAVHGEFAESASVETSDDQGLTIYPHRPGAPIIWLSIVTEHEISCDIAGTGFWIWEDDPSELPIEVSRVVRNVILHGFLQAGQTGRVPTSDGHIAVGLWTFTPWRWLRPKKTFLSFV